MKYPREVYDIEQELRSALSWVKDYEREFRPNSQGYDNIKRSIQSAERALAAFGKIGR